MRFARRLSLPLAALLSILLMACASSAKAPAKPRIASQVGNLKAHPGLLGQPVPPELQTPAGAETAEARRR